MVKSTAVKPANTVSSNTKPASTTTPTKKTTVSTKTPENTVPKPATKVVAKPVEEKPVKPVKETAKAIDTQVMKEKQEKQAQIDVTNVVKPNGTKPPAVKKSEQEITFTWAPTGAEKVQITGSFNDWKQVLDMNHVGDKHELSIPLKPGKYTYKFIVDGEWCYDFTEPNESDPDGNVNNIITV